jgi:Sec-independent protein translocase protein TatA
MLGINFLEFVVILCVVVIFIRPRDLPRFFHNIGKVYGQLKDTYKQLAKTRDEVLQDLKSEIDSGVQPMVNLDNDPAYSDPYAHFTADAEKQPSRNDGKI